MNPPIDLLGYFGRVDAGGLNAWIAGICFQSLKKIFLSEALIRSQTT